jgi:ABC-type transport system involved in cytochrome c biogenesis permease component
MFFFGTPLLFVFHFLSTWRRLIVGMALRPPLARLLFTGTLGLAQLFQAERFSHCLDALLLAPLTARAVSR